MADDTFPEYRALILAHMEQSNRRHTDMETALVDIKVQLGVLVLKVSIIVAGLLAVAGLVMTYMVNSTVANAARQLTEDAPK